MATVATYAPRFTSVVVAAATDAARRYQSGRESAALAPGFAPHTALNLHFFGGRTIEHLTFTHVYLGGTAYKGQIDFDREFQKLAERVKDLGQRST